MPKCEHTCQLLWFPCWVCLLSPDNQDHVQTKFLKKDSVPDFAAILQVDVVDIKRGERELSAKCARDVQVEVVNIENPLYLAISNRDCLYHWWACDMVMVSKENKCYRCSY